MKLELNKFTYPTVFCYRLGNSVSCCDFYIFVCFRFKFKMLNLNKKVKIPANKHTVLHDNTRQLHKLIIYLPKT